MRQMSLEPVGLDCPDSLEQQLRKTTSVSALTELFSQAWEVIRSGNLYSGQPRNSTSAESLALARLVLTTAVNSRNSALAGDAHRMMAYALNANEHYQDSIHHYEQSIAALERSGDFHTAARTRLGLVAALSMLSRYPEAIEAAHVSEDWFRNAGDHEGRARVFANLGNLYHRLDQHSRAAEYQRDAIEIFRRTKNTRALAQCYLNLGATLSILDEYEQAERAYRFSERLSRRLGLDELYAQARYNRVYLSFLRGKYSRAIAGFQQLRKYFVRNGSERHAALCDLDQAEIHLQLNSSAEALVLARSAAGICHTLGLRYEAAKAITFEGIALAQQGKFVDALAAFEKARRRFESENNHYWAASLQLYRAQVYLVMHRPEDAARLALSARERFEALQAPSRVAMSLVLMADAAISMRDYENARRWASEIAGLIDENAIPLHLFPCYRVCGEVAEHTGEPDKALRFYRLAAEEAELQRGRLDCDELRIAFTRDKQDVYASLVQLSLEQPDEIVQAYEWCERAKSRALVDLLSNHLASVAAPDAHPLLNRIEQLDEQLSSYSARSDSAQPSRHRDWQDIKGKRDELALDLDQLSDRHPEYVSLRKVRIADTGSIQRSLPKHTALIEYFVAGDEVMAFALSKDTVRVYRRLGDRNEIEQLREWLAFQMDMRKADTQCKSEGDEHMLAAARHHLHELYRQLVEPIVKDLAASHLVIVPHGVMHYLPFHAFFDGESYLLDRYTISYAPSASVFHYCSSRPDVDGDPVLMGIADEVAPLIEREIQEVQKSSGSSRVFIGAEATKKAFREEARSASFVHIATHSVFDRQTPMSSSFKLADGWLSALELYSMRCDVNLITLSGCRSGISEVTSSDELLGLVRGFLYTGARSLLLSLWDVDDETTSAFMSRFYSEWRGGKTKAQALKVAAQAIRQSRPHPLYWAPFYLVGKP